MEFMKLTKKQTEKTDNECCFHFQLFLQGLEALQATSKLSNYLKQTLVQKLIH